jgi:hypothetical protein
MEMARPECDTPLVFVSFLKPKNRNHPFVSRMGGNTTSQQFFISQFFGELRTNKTNKFCNFLFQEVRN